MKPLPFEKGHAFSDDELEKLDRVASWALPSEYRSFARDYGGAFVGGLVDGDASLPVLSFLSFDQAYRASADRSALPHNLPIAFARCELGNLWVFDRSGSVHYVNYYSQPAVSKMIATDFSDFVLRIVVTEE